MYKLITLKKRGRGTVYKPFRFDLNFPSLKTPAPSVRPAQPINPTKMGIVSTHRSASGNSRIRGTDGKCGIDGVNENENEKLARKKQEFSNQTGIKKVLGCLTAVILFPAQGAVQYRPIGSPERHEITLGRSFENPFSSRKTRLSKQPGYFLSYDLYLPEINSLLLPEKWRRIGYMGFTVSGSLYQNKKTDSLCGGKKLIWPARAGIKIKMSHFEMAAPFVEYGLSRVGCVGKKSKFNEILKSVKNNPLKLKTYFSIGLNMSFKILDRKSIYTLDQDYGLNDMGIRGQCQWHRGSKSSVFVCTAGFSLLF